MQQNYLLSRVSKEPTWIRFENIMWKEEIAHFNWLLDFSQYFQNSSVTVTSSYWQKHFDTFVADCIWKQREETRTCLSWAISLFVIMVSTIFKKDTFIDRYFHILTYMYLVVCFRIVVCRTGLSSISFTVDNPIPPACWRLCSREHLKTLWEKENMLIMRNYSFLQCYF